MDQTVRFAPLVVRPLSPKVPLSLLQAAGLGGGGGTAWLLAQGGRTGTALLIGLGSLASSVVRVGEYRAVEWADPAVRAAYRRVTGRHRYLERPGLPGPLGDSALLEWDTPDGPVAVVRRGTTYTVVLDAWARSTALEDVEERVSRLLAWGELQAELCTPTSLVSRLGWYETAGPADPLAPRQWFEEHRQVPPDHAFARGYENVLAAGTGNVQHRVHLVVQIDRARFMTARAVKRTGRGDVGAMHVLMNQVGQLRARLEGQHIYSRTLGPRELRGEVLARLDPGRAPLLATLGGSEEWDFSYEAGLDHVQAEGQVHVAGRFVSLPESERGASMRFMERLLLYPTYVRTIAVVMEPKTAREARADSKNRHVGVGIARWARQWLDIRETAEHRKTEEAPETYEQELADGAGAVDVYTYGSVTAPDRETAEAHWGLFEADASNAGMQLRRRWFGPAQLETLLCTLPLGRVS